MTSKQRTDKEKKYDRKSQHVVPSGEKWGVRAANSERPSKLFKTKRMAIAHAFDVADNNEGKIIIHDKGGKIRKIKVTEDTSKLMSIIRG